MKFPYLTENDSFLFPDPRTARGDGIVAMGGNLSPGMLLSAYRQGIFPWFSEEYPILWWSPDPRFVVFPGELHISGSMKKILRRGCFSFSLDRCFRDVMTACSQTPRPGQRGTWITADMIEAYCRLHELGRAHSVEVWSGGNLAGGLYGIALGHIFFGESMFSLVSNASKAAFIFLVKTLADRGFELIDSQIRTAHVAALGGRDIPREDYLARLSRLIEYDTPREKWETAGT
jgi:leucyl/phenylalanyl-tRNA--protein transferase